MRRIEGWREKYFGRLRAPIVEFLLVAEKKITYIFYSFVLQIFFIRLNKTNVLNVLSRLLYKTFYEKS